jgi:hypothetical protein
VSAIVIAAQPKFGLIHAVTDAAYYEPNQKVVAFGTKVFPVTHWPGMVTSAGNAAAYALFGWSLSQDFATFDELSQ